MAEPEYYVVTYGRLGYVGNGMDGNIYHTVITTVHPIVWLESQGVNYHLHTWEKITPAQYAMVQEVRQQRRNQELARQQEKERDKKEVKKKEKGKLLGLF